MAKPRRRGIPRVPGLPDPKNRKGNAGKARDIHVLGNTAGKKNGRPYVHNSVTPQDPRYGPNRLLGAEEATAKADLKREGKPTTQDAINALTGEEVVEGTFWRPTHHLNPSRPRSKLAAYDGKSHTVFILFRYKEDRASLEGAIYAYLDTPYNVWRMVKRNVSTGRTIDRTLNNYQYVRIR